MTSLNVSAFVLVFVRFTEEFLLCYLRKVDLDVLKSAWFSVFLFLSSRSLPYLKRLPKIILKKQGIYILVSRCFFFLCCSLPARCPRRCWPNSKWTLRVHETLKIRFSNQSFVRSRVKRACFPLLLWLTWSRLLIEIQSANFEIMNSRDKT